ncbi:MAG: alpha/beta fold hydrolase [Xanthobacteraceae bacterium]
MGTSLRRLVIVAAAATAVWTCGAFAQPAFYRATEQETIGPPGTLIRQEPIHFAPSGASAYRVLYRSVGLRNEPIAVSGLVIIPGGPPPAAGRPIVAWAHPTTGVTPPCAPSLALERFAHIQGLKTLIDRGYVVTATDYPGLGTPGPHPYLVGVSEARAVLDSVRVVRTLPNGGNGNRFAVWGHSQGGHAALFTGIVGRQYAPELELAGVAAAAPATELAALLVADIDTLGGKDLTAMALWSWARVFDAPMSRVVVPTAIPTVDRLARDCLETRLELLMLMQAAKPLDRSFLSVKNLADVQPWRSFMTENTPGALPSNIPVFLAQGGADQLVRPDITRNYMQRLCGAGSKVEWFWMPKVGHPTAGRDSADAAAAWMTGRFDGKPVPNDCGK